MIKLKEYSFFILIICMFALLLIFSKDAFYATQDGLDLFIKNVFPSIFPFLILSNILINSNTINKIYTLFNPLTKYFFKLPGISFLPIILGFISGYPVGAKITNDLYSKNLLSKQQAESLLAFTNNASPLFILSYVGISIFHDVRTGFLLLLAHTISAILVGMILGIFNKKDYNNYLIKTTHTPIPITKNIILSVKNSVNTILIIGGFIIFFSVIIKLLTNSYFFNIIAIPITYILNTLHIPTIIIIPTIQGLLEMTNGLYSLNTMPHLPYLYKTCISSFLLGFGGISIYMQTIALVIDNNLNTFKYFIGKILQGVIAFILTYILIIYTPFFNLDVIDVISKPSTNINNIILLEKSNILFNTISIIIIFIASFKIFQIHKSKRINL